MAGFGLVLGGAAEGFGKGVKLAKDYEDQKRQQEIEQGQRNSEAVVQAIPLPGTTVDGRWTPDSAVNAALEKAKPRPDLIQRMVTGVAHKLRPQEAAVASGVTPPPPPPTDGTAAPGDANAPTDSTVGGITVAPPQPHQVTDVEHARMLVAASHMLKGPTAAAAQQDAWNNLHKLEGEALQQDVQVAAMRGPDGLANYLTKATHHDVEINPVEGKDGLYTYKVDGNDSGTPMSLAQLSDQAIAFATRNPAYSLQASLQRREADRADTQLHQTKQYQDASIAIQRAQAATSARLAEIQGSRTSMENAKDQAALDEVKQEHALLNSFQAKILDHGGAGDALLNEDELNAIAQAAPVNMRSAMTSKVITDPSTGAQHVETENNVQTMAKNAIEAAQARYQASPYVQGGVLQKSRVPMGDGSTRNFYTVKGVNDGAFTNLDAAEMAARKLYPKLSQPAAPKGKPAPATSKPATGIPLG